MRFPNALLIILQILIFFSLSLVSFVVFLFYFPCAFIEWDRARFVCEKESKILLWNFRCLILLSNEELKKSNTNAKKPIARLTSLARSVWFFILCTRAYVIITFLRLLFNNERVKKTRLNETCACACACYVCLHTRPRKKRNFNRCLLTCSLNSVHRKIYITINKYNKMKRVIHQMKKHITNIHAKNQKHCFLMLLRLLLLFECYSSASSPPFFPIVCCTHKKMSSLLSHSSKMSIHKRFICYFIVSNHFCFVVIHLLCSFFSNVYLNDLTVNNWRSMWFWNQTRRNKHRKILFGKICA